MHGKMQAKNENALITKGPDFDNKRPFAFMVKCRPIMKIHSITKRPDFDNKRP